MAGLFQGKVVVVTGASRGIGRACAELFATEGALVAAVSRKRFPVKQRGVLSYAADVGDEKAVARLFAAVVKEWGRVDILINNAGIVELAPVSSLKLKVWEDVIRTNLTGMFLCAREFFRVNSKKSKGKCIVNVSSLSGVRGVEKFPGMSAYVTSKFGVVGLTEALAVEGKPLGIRVNCIAPGAVETDLLKKAAPFLRTKTKPEDMAELIAEMASPSTPTTGEVVEVHCNLE